MLTKILLTISAFIIAILGVQSSSDIDHTLMQLESPSPIYNGRLPLSDSEESANYHMGRSLDSSVYLFTKDKLAYTKEYYNNGTIYIVTIPIEVFPHWQLADSIEGVDIRFTDTWTEIASGKAL